MFYSLDAWLPVVRPHLGENLVDPIRFEHLSQVARHLPGDAMAALELRLAAGSKVVDLSVRLTTPSQARHAARSLPVPHLSRFLIRWADGAASLAAVSAVWLEFDLGHPPIGTLPMPSVCARFEGPCERDWLVHHLLPALQGQPLSRWQKEMVRDAFDRIPPSAHLLYAFSMLSRPGQPLRLELFGPRPAQMVPYLRGLMPQSPEAAGALEVLAEVAPLFEDLDRVHLAFDLGSEVQPAIGIDGSYARWPHREPRWARFFDRLVEAGLCAPDKRDAIFGFPGYDSSRSVGEGWPRSRKGVAIPGFCVRALSHVKAVCRPTGAPEAKAYLLIQHLERSKTVQAEVPHQMGSIDF